MKKTQKRFLHHVLLCIAFFVFEIIQTPASPMPETLIFHAKTENGNQLYKVNPPTLTMENILSFEDNTRPDRIFWSPDGNNFGIPFHSYGPNVTEATPDQICIYSKEGIELNCLETNLWGISLYFPLSWTSDSNEIWVVTKSENNQPQLEKFDIATSAIVSRITLPLQQDEELTHIYWGFGGNNLAYQTQPIGENRVQHLNLYSFDTNTLNAIHLTNESSLTCVAWFPNSPNIAVVLNNGITVFDDAGKSVSRIAPVYENREVLGCPLSVANQGTSVAFLAGYNDPQTLGLFITDVETFETHLLADIFYPVYSIAWSPDDSLLAVDTVYGGGYSDIRVISLNGETYLYQIDGIPLISPSWQPLVSSVVAYHVHT